MKITPLVVIAAAVASLAGCGRAPQGESASNTITPSRNAAPAARVEAAAPDTATLAQRAAPRDAITDSVITTRVKAGILSDPGMAGSDVSVNTDRGVVTLTGLVKTQEQAAIASAHAQRPDGVLRIENHLAVDLH